MFAPYFIALILRFIPLLESYQGTTYVVLYTLFIFVVFYFRSKFLFIKKSFIVHFSLASCLLIGTTPFLENDQYRYLWEGKLIAAGENPYFKSPSDPSLNSINFPERNKIAYNKIAGLYPPLALGFFSLFSSLKYDQAMILLQIIHLLLCLVLLQVLSRFTVFDFRVLWIIPFLMKEYVQAVHIDLLAFIPFAFFLVTKNRWGKEILYWLSIWLKWLPLALLPARFIKLAKKKDLVPFLTVGSIAGFVLLLTFLFLFKLKPGEYSGPYAFSFFWKWNAGLYQFLLSSFSFKHITIKSICLIVFCLFYCFYLWRSHFKVQALTLYIFSALFFTAHVYNAWYGLWILIPALSLRNNYLLLYSISAYTSYLLYDFENWEFICSLLTHIWFLLGLKQLFKDSMTRRKVF